MPTFLTITGTITECTQEQPPLCQKVVYQKVAPGTGNLPGNGTWNAQRRRWVRPFDPRSPAQVAHRTRFAMAVTSWQQLAAEQRAAWRPAGASRNISGFNAFMSAYLRS